MVPHKGRFGEPISRTQNGLTKIVPPERGPAYIAVTLNPAST